MFFVLVVNDCVVFDNIFDWMQNNFVQGFLKECLFVWLWGKKENSKWEVLDSNLVFDGDVWMVWLLLEVGCLWKEQCYIDIGSVLLKCIVWEEVVMVSGLGFMLLLGKVGFVEDNSWCFNFSYLLLMLVQYFICFGVLWIMLCEIN